MLVARYEAGYSSIRFQVKVEHQKPVGLLQALPIGAWMTITRRWRLP